MARSVLTMVMSNRQSLEQQLLFTRAASLFPSSLRCITRLSRMTWKSSDFQHPQRRHRCRRWQRDLQWLHPQETWAQRRCRHPRRSDQYLLDLLLRLGAAHSRWTIRVMMLFARLWRIKRMMTIACLRSALGMCMAYRSKYAYRGQSKGKLP